MSRHTEKFQRSEFRHNPYIGTFQRTEGTKQDINRHNPYIGYVNRHAPSDGHGALTGVAEKPFRRNFISNITISQQRRPVNMLALKNLPLSLYTKPSNKAASGEECPVCAICLEAFNDGDELRNLNCSHCFHRACVDIWLLGTLSDDIQLNGTCPTCRQHATHLSPKKPKGLQVMTSFAPSDQSAHMSDLSVRSSSITVSSGHSTASFDILSPMSPDWSHDEIFHQEQEENCLNIGQLLVEGSICSSPPLEVDVASIESLEYSCQSICIDDCPSNPNSSSDLENIHEDEPIVIETSSSVPGASLTRPPYVSILDEDCDVVSVFSVSQYSDCGFPLSSPKASLRKNKTGE